MTENNKAAAVRKGRRPGTTNTRQVILSAARARFAADGFSGTTIRRIAEDADVDAALVMQYFRSKEELFAAVMSLPAEALIRITGSFDGPVDSLGERVVRAYFDVWEGVPEHAEPLMAMLRGAIVNEQAREALREFIEARLLEAINSRSADRADAALRAGVASSLLVGLVVGRRIVGVPTLAKAGQEELTAIIAPAIQAVLTPAP
jgi:AcrR family transcriptional regulator